MNDKLKVILLISLIFFIIIIINKPYLKKESLNHTNIKDAKILKYVPTENEILLLSEFDNKDITKFFENNFQSEDDTNLKNIKNGILSILGLDLLEDIKEFYDNEFAFIKPNYGQNNKEILLIFKVKANHKLNDIIEIKDDSYEENKIIEITEVDKLKYLPFILKTSDNYIICASNKDLISISLDFLKNQDLEKERREQLNKYKKLINNDKLLLITRNNFITKNIENNALSKKLNFLTLFEYQDNTINLKSYSFNSPQFNNQNGSNPISFKKSINGNYIYSNNTESFLLYDLSLLTNTLQKKIYQELKRKLNNRILIFNDKKDWILGVQKNKPESNIIEELAIIKTFHKDSYFINNNRYNIYSKNLLKSSENKVIYEKEDPIFTYESENFILISNNLSTLLMNIEEKKLLKQIILNEIDNFNILNDILIIKSPNNNQINKDILFLRYLNLLSANNLNFSLKNLIIEIKQEIPLDNPYIYTETDLNLSNNL